ncbi:hypothetical protein H310_12822 [Aphanomyces invadans]|uniref:Folate/biopterin transporter n=1 Tax=Aphanomyces invadans TaxID=157072 RepID=A0A024TI06_9STRA|nr:hypothetical protein H310_12822 [Aphanomyces invadans]ETV93226.1 hypothetical protein H310_12822 [Aphanomyces invadans]|eukprot:XP_008878248.1 hypothetical protein H310_12822 [Aphanomyces invadans]
MAFLANFASGSLLPWGLLLLYFVQSFLQSFPITAYGDWLFNEIHMSPATTNVYYALTFFPWNLKPVYALVSDNFPIFGYRRKYYIVLCEIGAALSVLATGLFVRSVAGAFVVKMIDSSCEAFTQMMLGVVLVDVASGNHEKSGNVQAWANAAKNTASIVALVVGIPIYANKSISSREIICWSSVIPVMGILISLYLLHEPRVSLLPRSSAHPTNPQTCTYLVHRKWRGFVAACKRIMSEQRAYVPVMIFFFLSSALPSGGSVWYQYTYSLLNDQKECLQYASLAGMIGRVLACLMYAKTCHGYSIRTVFAISTVVSTVASLPQVLLAPPMARLPMSVCTFCTIESFVTSFAGEFALLQLLIVATYFCPTTATGGNGLTYALYLSFMDFGGVVSSFVSAIVINALGITEDPTTFVVNWSNLSWLVVIGAVCKLAILAFLCVLPTQVNVPDDEEDHQMQPLLPRAGSADVSP